MKSLLPIILMLLIAAPSISQKNQEQLGLPELHKIHEVTLSPTYSCRSDEDFRKGYANTALFLSGTLREFNSPELIFNGACDARDYVEAGSGGSNMSMIADLGKIRLEDLKTIQAFNVPWVASQKYFSQFTGQIEPKLDHTYALVINHVHKRGLVYFTITGYVPNQRLDLRYVVKQFESMKVLAQSPGFDWER